MSEKICFTPNYTCIYKSKLNIKLNDCQTRSSAMVVSAWQFGPQAPAGGYSLLNDHNFISANHPGNVAHGGVGLFYKCSLPVTHPQDLSFDE